MFFEKMITIYYTREMHVKMFDEQIKYARVLRMVILRHVRVDIWDQIYLWRYYIDFNDPKFTRYPRLSQRWYSIFLKAGKASIAQNNTSGTFRRSPPCPRPQLFLRIGVSDFFEIYQINYIVSENIAYCFGFL